MHEVIAKIARFAVSKVAAFCYAVAVGVAGNLIFHFVQLHDVASAVATPAAVTAPKRSEPTGERATAAPYQPPASTAPAPSHASLSTSPARPAPPRAVATAPIPPEPPAVSLPSLGALPVPPLKPTALPPAALRPAALPPTELQGEAPVTPAPKPTALPSEAALPATPEPAGDAANPARSFAPAFAPAFTPPPAAALPPIGPAIDVAAPPMPPPPSRALPARIAVPPAPAAQAAASKEAPGSLELSDVWHPYRAVKKGLHWAGEQVPLIGDGDAAPPARAAPLARAAPPAAPISLLPLAAKPAASENAETSIPPPKPTAPGPGSGGLY